MMLKKVQTRLIELFQTKVTRLTSNQTRLILIFSLALIGIWIVHLLTTQKDNFWNLSGLLIGVIALFFTIDERRNKKFIDTYDNISQAIKEVKTEIISEMERKDFVHDQQLIKLATDISIANIRIDLHAQETGHKGLLEEVFRIKDAMSDINANVALITQQGRITHQLDQVRLNADRLEAMVEKLRVEIGTAC